jgi:hypothetical protein
MQTTKTPKISKVGRWKSKNNTRSVVKGQDNLFAEVLVQEDDENDDLLLKNKKDYHRSVYTSLEEAAEDSSSTSSLSYSSPSEGEEEEIEIVNYVKKAPHRISLQQRNVQRIKRSLWQKTVLYARSIISILLSAPILATFLAIATWRTGKAYILDSYYYKKTRPQDFLEHPIPDELLVPDETYYAGRWGYTSEMHEVLTQDGYILRMYRIFKKGTNPQGTTD